MVRLAVDRLLKVKSSKKKALIDAIAGLDLATDALFPHADSR